jgi:hypothetical protein
VEKQAEKEADEKLAQEISDQELLLKEEEEMERINEYLAKRKQRE